MGRETCLPLEPHLGIGEVGRGETMAGAQHLLGDVRSAGPEERGEAGRLVRGNDRIDGAVEQERTLAGERARGGGLIEHDHGTQQQGAGQGLGPQQEQGGGDVGAVGKADCDEPGGVDSMGAGGGGDEVGQLVGASDNLRGIKDPLGQPGKEARRAVLADIAARTEHGVARGKGSGQREQVALGATSAVEQEQRPGGNVRARLKKMVKGRRRHG